MNNSEPQLHATKPAIVLLFHDIMVICTPGPRTRLCNTIFLKDLLISTILRTRQSWLDSSKGNDNNCTAKHCFYMKATEHAAAQPQYHSCKKFTVYTSLFFHQIDPTSRTTREFTVKPKWARICLADCSLRNGPKFISRQWADGLRHRLSVCTTPTWR